MVLFGASSANVSWQGINPPGAGGNPPSLLVYPATTLAVLAPLAPESCRFSPLGSVSRPGFAGSSGLGRKRRLNLSLFWSAAADSLIGVLAGSGRAAGDEWLWRRAGQRCPGGPCRRGKLDSRDAARPAGSLCHEALSDYRTLWQPEPPLELLLSEPILNRSPEVNTDPTHRPSCA